MGLLEDKVFLKRAVELAQESVDEGGFPAGALIVKDGKIIAEGISIGNKLHDPTSHAETASIKKACISLETVDLSGATLYESLQSCIMCFSVSNWANISRIVYACRKTDGMIKKGFYEGSTDNQILNQENNHKIELVFIPDFEKDSLNIISNWEKSLNK